jgi:hypothetical protein
MGRLGEAEPLMRRALAINEKTLGAEHPKVAIRLNNLALLLEAMDRPAEAEPLIRQALAITEKNFGPEHPTTATRLNNLAMILDSLNRPAEAEPPRKASPPNTRCWRFVSTIWRGIAPSRATGAMDSKPCVARPKSTSPTAAVCAKAAATVKNGCSPTA